MTIAVFNPALQADCIKKVKRAFPLETGGVFMGFWRNSNFVVITKVIGPGPKAKPALTSFEPDQDWQLSQIADYYNKSDRRETYLGDWHSHPEAQNGDLSITDTLVLRRIIKTPKARTKKPLMAIFFGKPDDWGKTLWCAKLKPRKFLWPKLVLEELNIFQD